MKTSKEHMQIIAIILHDIKKDFKDDSYWKNKPIPITNLLWALTSRLTQILSNDPNIKPFRKNELHHIITYLYTRTPEQLVKIGIKSLPKIKVSLETKEE